MEVPPSPSRSRPSTPSRNSSTSSAVDLGGTAGLVSSSPASPALNPSDSKGSFARRRTSWGRVEPGQDPLRLDLPSFEQGASKGSSAARVMHNSEFDEDPFSSPTDELPHLAHDYPIGSGDTRYGNVYSTSQPGPSTVALIPPSYRTYSGDSRAVDGSCEDDEAHLTSNMVQQGSSKDWSTDEEADTERLGGTMPRMRRKTGCYSVSPSPLKRAGTALGGFSRNLRRASLRVVNFSGLSTEDRIRLADEEDDDNGDIKGKGKEEDTEDPQRMPHHDLLINLPVRGRTLGFLDARNPVRLAMFNFLVSPWTEPAVLVLIVVNAIVLTIQASPTLTAPGDSNNPGLPSPVKGYFRSWEDYVLFALFIIFTLEAFARISVSGLILDPEVSVSSLCTSPFSSSPDTSNSAASNNSNIVAYSMSQPQGPLHRGNSITQRLHRIQSGLIRPFALANNSFTYPPNSTMQDTHRPARTRSDTASSTTPMHEKTFSQAQNFDSHIRNPSHPTFLSTTLRSDRTRSEPLSLPFRLNVNLEHAITRRNVPYLRHSWGRIDFLAIVGFWITFILASTGVERGTHHIGMFRALSVLRTARLLGVTSGTTTIMRSLKTARPLLTGVAYFVLFAMALFSIVGVETFAGSFKRSCYLEIDSNSADDINLGQPCGAYIDPVSLNVTGYIQASDGQPGRVKGFVCPLGQVCREGQNPYNGIENFDTFYNAVLQVIIIASANGWSPLMYSVIDSEYFASCFFFIVCILVLNFWLINLFVAVITNTFSAIRANTKKSAFGATPVGPVISEQDDDWQEANGKPSKPNALKQIYEYIRWCWVALALASLILQATRTTSIGQTHQTVLDKGELALTLVFDLEIFIRFFAEFPQWRSFFSGGRNWLDTILALGSTIIQIPAVHNSDVYPWLTIFQISRFYRVILEVPRMRPLLLAVFGNMYGLANMTLFLLLMNYLAALIAVQLLRGDLVSDEPMNFGEIFTSFLAIYQIFSSENWTDVLYGAMQSEIPLGQSVIVAVFVSTWFLFANFIVLQMFIAVINENFDVAEETKKGQQASNYWAKQQPEAPRAGWLRRLNPYRWLNPSPKTIKVVNLPSHLVLPMQKSLVQNSNLPFQESAYPDDQVSGHRTRSQSHFRNTVVSILQSFFVGKAESRSQDVPLNALRAPRRASMVPEDAANADMDRHLELLAIVNTETTPAGGISEEEFERRAMRADFIRDHPTYDKTFWIFSQKNTVRQLCQKLVQPAGGERIFGAPPSPIAHPLFQLFLLLAVIAGIVVEGIASPVYRRAYYQKHGLIRGSWFDIAETALGLTLLVEFIIKIVADGFLFTPNHYFKSIWNVLDLAILGGIVVNLTTGLIFIGGLSRLTRSLKALRALRLITLIENMRSTFQSLILSGAARIFDAALLALLYMIPYAVWGLNIFAGLMWECNDTGVSGASQCNYEYTYNTDAAGNDFGFLVPRVWSNPSPSTTFSFDTFRASLLILFEIVSLEGWIDVLNFATGITGPGQQPSYNTSQVNAIFFLIYNLMGGVVILTLFVSIIVGNFRAKTGAALLTQPQREWIDLQKLIKRQRPSRRPKTLPRSRFRSWCFERAVHKHGWWSRMMTVVFVVHVFALMTQTSASQHIADNVRAYWFLFASFVYTIDTSVRLIGLGFSSFRANGWNLFDIIVASGALLAVIIVLVGHPPEWIQQLQKLFIVSIAFKLVQRTNSLNKLFKTAMASLSVIISLLALWLVLFLFFGILFLEIFGLTKWYSGEDWNRNYVTMGSALVMLAFMSTGEGWNQYMHDYAIVYPQCTNAAAKDEDSDCGSVGWAFTLFIAWNVLSMYIFVNMFTGVVVESFSYVFQSTGGAKSITREEMRAFKKVWAEFANQKTGYLERSRFVPFFGRLSGIFEVRIYPREFSVDNIVAACRSEKDAYDVDMRKLTRILDGIDYSSIRRRRTIYNRLYHEAVLFHEKGKGISFTNMLLMLAHHKLIDDREALVLKDLVVRTDQNKLVSDLVNLDRVRSLLRMITLRRRFVAERDRMRDLRMSQQDIPAIVVEGLPGTPPFSRDITSPSPGWSPTISPSLSPLSPVDVSFALDTTAGLQRSSRRLSDTSMLTTDTGRRHSREMSPSRESHYGDDAQAVLTSIQTSVWGEMMLEAAEDEED
ncbi:hypothetical protein NEOLEDRAFT_1238275 [Neolentinus lepideus HHB14362 ss-1]|uniref:Calcium-channel protein CCH1 n=1 Tax=Neolentinus lepideus HHB14362 ss-1 TaxID=1314782 RepID=A0A165VT32_9AGAM|nr:hypothetical protein NEOLEDRAFT_1238275 [Neolentinus lepideus HHB14362 ss-1]